MNELQARGASFFAQLQQACTTATSDEILAALWQLVWAGLVTNDTFQPLRAVAAARRRVRTRAPTRTMTMTRRTPRSGSHRDHGRRYG